jgi:hypothetical protein
MRPLSLAAAATLCVIVCVGCGSSSQPPSPQVRLAIDSPTDGVRTLAGAVSISGIVSPDGATVLVAGKVVTVTGGSFKASISIRPGSNVVDILASAPEATDAMSAVRIYRQVLIAIPNIGGESPTQATLRLTSVGLTANIQEGGGFLEPIIPGTPHVCGTDPAAGHTVAPGTAVVVHTAKLCSL